MGILGQNFVGKCSGKGIAISYEDAKTEFLTLFLKCFYKNHVIKYAIKVNLCIIDNHRYLQSINKLWFLSDGDSK